MMKKRSLSFFTPPRTPSRADSPRKKPPKILTLATPQALLEQSSILDSQPWIESSVDKFTPQATIHPLLPCPQREILPFDPSPQLAEKWCEFIRGQNTPAADEEEEEEGGCLYNDDINNDGEEYVDGEPPPPYASIIASTVVLSSPGKPKVVDIFPPASIKSRTPPASNPSSPHDRSRASTHYSECNTTNRTRSLSVYSRESGYFPTETPTSHFSESSVALSQLVTASKDDAITASVQEVTEEGLLADEVELDEPLLEPTSFLRDATPLGFYDDLASSMAS